MVKVEHSIVISAPVEEVFDLVADFASYSDFQPEVEESSVLKKGKSTADVAFTVKLISRVQYTLRFKLNRPKNITWTMVKGDSLLKTNSGSWNFKKVNGSRTKLTCSMDVEFGRWIPKSIVGGLMDSHLPAMLRRFKEHAGG